jgi:hypothetical protein
MMRKVKVLWLILMGFEARVVSELQGFTCFEEGLHASSIRLSAELTFGHITNGLL